MGWFWIALINPLVLAFINHFDKFLLSKYIKGGTVGALIVFSALFAIIAIPVVILIDPNVLHSASLIQGLILMGNGALLTLAILLYLYAIDSDEASYVVPFFEFIPIFGLILSFLILGEVLSSKYLLSGGIIVAGGVILSLDLTPSPNRFKKKLVLLMLGSSFFYALNAVIFKYIALDLGFVNSLFWDLIGKFILGVLLLLSIKSYQKQFFYLIKNNGIAITGLNIVNEILGLLGEFALVLAIMYAPVALVQSVGSTHSAFVLIIGIIITLFFPKFGKETLEKKHLTQKIIGITLMIIGVYFLGF